MTQMWRNEQTPKTVPDRAPRQHVPASVPWTLAMLFVILLAFLLVVWSYTR